MGCVYRIISPLSLPRSSAITWANVRAVCKYPVLIPGNNLSSEAVISLRLKSDPSCGIMIRQINRKQEAQARYNARPYYQRCEPDEEEE